MIKFLIYLPSIHISVIQMSIQFRRDQAGPERQNQSAENEEIRQKESAEIA